MLLKIVQIGNPVLRKKAKALQELTTKHNELITNMLETLKDSGGVGLAAPQVNKAIQIIIADVSEVENPLTYFKINNKDENFKNFMPIIAINPKLELIGKKVEGEEGCLSIAEIRESVKRYEQIKLKALNIDFEPITIETDGMLARVFQHEVDHLNGILFIDRLPTIKKNKIRNKIKTLIQDQKQSEKES